MNPSSWLFNRLAGIVLALAAALVISQGCTLNTKGEGAFPEDQPDSAGFGGNSPDVLPGTGGASGQSGSAGFGGSEIDAAVDQQIPEDAGPETSLLDADGSTSEDADASPDVEDAPNETAPDASPDSEIDAPEDVQPDTSESGIDAPLDSPPDSDGQVPETGPDAEPVDAAVLTCHSSEMKTPTSINASGKDQTSAYLHFHDGTEVYSTNNPATLPLTATFPAEFVASGLNQLYVGLNFGMSYPIGGLPFYEVDVSATSECAGANYYTQSCEAKVAKDFRCLFFPASEAGCSVTAKFSLAETNYAHINASPGNHKFAVAFRCLQ